MCGNDSISKHGPTELRRESFFVGDTLAWIYNRNFALLPTLFDFLTYNSGPPANDLIYRHRVRSRHQIPGLAFDAARSKESLFFFLPPVQRSRNIITPPNTLPLIFRSVFTI